MFDILEKRDALPAHDLLSSPDDKKPVVAVIGATGLVGREILSILQERAFPYEKVHAVASKNSEGKPVVFGKGEPLTAKSLDGFKFTNIDIVLGATCDTIAEQYASDAKEAGALIIDNSCHFRQMPKIPLIIPEVNGSEIDNYEKGIIANPNCSTIQMIMALKPLHDLFHVRSINVSTYQSASGAGKSAMEELNEQTSNFYANKKMESNVFPKQIAHNVIPQIGSFNSDNVTSEEKKMVDETKKILSENIDVVATCVRVPVFVGHGLAVHAEFKEKINLEDAKNALKNASGISLVNDDKDYITPLDVAGKDDVYVSRLRKTNERGLAFWCVADNLRKGAALNAVQIAEYWMDKQRNNS